MARIRLLPCETAKRLRSAFAPYGARMKFSYWKWCMPKAILTRPEGRVQHRLLERDRHAVLVSILTRPEEQVQLPTLNIPLPKPFRRLNREPPEDCATWIPP